MNMYSYIDNNITLNFAKVKRFYLNINNFCKFTFADYFYAELFGFF